MKWTIFERFVANPLTKTHGGDWDSRYRYTLYEECDLTKWDDRYIEAMIRIGADYDGDTVYINNKLYYVNCSTKTIFGIKSIRVPEPKED